MKNKLITKTESGFIIGRVEFYKVIGKPDLSIHRSMCGCLIFTIYKVGFTLILNKECLSYNLSKEIENGR